MLESLSGVNRVKKFAANADKVNGQAQVVKVVVFKCANS